MMNHPHQMRRKDREITDEASLRDIVNGQNAAVMSMVDGDQPYGIMLNYAPVYHDGQLLLLFHGAKRGRKISCLESNPKVSLFINDASRTCVDTSNPNPAEWTTYYRSVIIQGTVRFLNTMEEKKTAVKEFLAHFSDLDITIPEPALKATCFYYVQVEHITGKESKRPETC